MNQIIKLILDHLNLIYFCNYSFGKVVGDFYIPSMNLVIYTDNGSRTKRSIRRSTRHAERYRYNIIRICYLTSKIEMFETIKFYVDELKKAPKRRIAVFVKVEHYKEVWDKTPNEARKR